MAKSRVVHRRSLLALAPVLAFSAVVAGGCGSSDSSDQAALAQARRQGAVAAHRADEVHQLQKQVSALKREQAGSTTGAEGEAGAAQGETARSADSRIPASGTYSGQAEQRGTPARVNKDYPLEMTFSSSGSYVSYPTLGCAGSLHPLGFDGPDRLYAETITSGHCDSGGTWHVRVDDETTLQGSWSLPSSSYSVTAVLER